MRRIFAQDQLPKGWIVALFKTFLKQEISYKLIYIPLF